ncbi:MAG: dephospho-CoA kinase [Limnobacter sp.]|nr:dephospho-CoA kinase [Limnobacter sp.]
MSENSSTRPLIVGLTGGIGSGKSQVSNRLAELGATIVDTDVIAHELTGPQGAAMEPLKLSFGPQCTMPDGSLNRDFMRAQITANPQAREQLENILHPLIRQVASSQIQQARSAYTVVVVPLLVEKGGWSDWMDEIVVVDCSRETQVQRVKARNGWPPEQIEHILNLQASRQERLEVASITLLNEVSKSELLGKIDELHEKLLLKASKLNNNLQQNDT